MRNRNIFMHLNIHFRLKQTCPHEKNFTFVMPPFVETFCRLLLRNTVFILEIMAVLKIQNSDHEVFQIFSRQQ